MENFDSRINDLAIKLFNIEAVKFGNFKMKSGSYSPIYFDLRVIVSHPNIMESLCDLLLELAPQKFKCDQLCGVPYTALPLATILSVKTKTPMLIRRKEAKAYGTKKLIEGQFKENDCCVIIEDVITSGSSILETVADLKREKLCIKDAVIILDRQQGGLENLKSNNIEVTSLLTMSKLLNVLLNADLINEVTFEKVKEYLKNTPTDLPIKPSIDRTTLSFDERSEFTKNPIAKKLFSVMSEKQSNLCLAADSRNAADILNLLEKTGPYICLLKLHVDIIEDFNGGFISHLKSLAKKHNVLLMEDRKYSDIGNTVALQYSSGVHKVGDWADLVTVHSLSGPGVINGIRSVMDDECQGIFLVAEMSSEGNLITPQYTEATMKMATEESDIVVGIVCQTTGIVNAPGMIQLTPGVQVSDSSDGLGQKYTSPENAILKKHADIAVVGRGIIKAKDPEAEAKMYRDKLWESYEARIM